MRSVFSTKARFTNALSKENYSKFLMSFILSSNVSPSSDVKIKKVDCDFSEDKYKSLNVWQPLKLERFVVSIRKVRINKIYV